MQTVELLRHLLIESLCPRRVEWLCSFKILNCSKGIFQVFRPNLHQKVHFDYPGPISLLSLPERKVGFALAWLTASVAPPGILETDREPLWVLLLKESWD